MTNDINKELAERFEGVLQIMRAGFELKFGYGEYGQLAVSGPAEIMELGFCDCRDHGTECHVSPCICSDSFEDIYTKTLGYEEDQDDDDDDDESMLFPQWNKNKITADQLKGADVESIYEYLCSQGYLKKWIEDFVKGSIETLS